MLLLPILVQTNFIERKLSMSLNLDRLTSSDAGFHGGGEGKHGMNAMVNPLKEAWKGGGEGLDVYSDGGGGGGG